MATVTFVFFFWRIFEKIREHSMKDIYLPLLKITDVFLQIVLEYTRRSNCDEITMTFEGFLVYKKSAIGCTSQVILASLTSYNHLLLYKI